MRLKNLLLFPVNAVCQIVLDATNSNKDDEDIPCIMSCGLTSVMKEIKRTITSNK